MRRDVTAQYSEIQKQHELLRADIARLRAAASAPPASAAEARPGALLVQGIARLHETLRKHFALEEQGGYLEPVMAARPGLSRTVQRLKQQHSAILAALTRLEGHFQAGTSPADARAEALLVLDLLASHELEETDLIQRVLTEDLGVGD